MGKPKYKSPLLCVICGKELLEINLNNSKEMDYGMVNGGIVGKIYAPFGSKFDGSIFQIGICDDCAEKVEPEGKIKEIGDYLYGSGGLDD